MAFLGELRIFTYGRPPNGWAPCEGQMMSIQGNTALFALLGTQFGGNGSTTFALPDLRARVPIHVGGGNVVGTAGGEAAHTLTPAEMPMHSHLAFANNAIGGVGLPSPSSRLANSEPGNAYGPPYNLAPMHPAVVGKTGGSGAHENRQPFLALSIGICLAGYYPPRSGIEEED